MAPFMDATKQARRQIFLEDPCRDPDIGRMKRGREGMGREIEAPTLEVIAHGGQHKPTEFHLLGLVETLVQATVVDGDVTGLNAP